MSDKKDKALSLRRFCNLPFWDDELWEMDVGSHTGLTVSEDQSHVYVEAQLPGINIDDIEISFEKGILWIKGEKKEAEEDKGKKYYRKAISAFSYRMHVPGQIDEKKEPEASYKDGVIKVAFTKAVGPQSKKITIKPKS